MTLAGGFFSCPELCLQRLGGCFLVSYPGDRARGLIFCPPPHDDGGWGVFYSISTLVTEPSGLFDCAEQ